MRVRSRRSAARSSPLVTHDLCFLGALSRPARSQLPRVGSPLMPPRPALGPGRTPTRRYRQSCGPKTVSA
jgi:hypothetical protein